MICFCETYILREYLNQSKFMAFGAQYNEELYIVNKKLTYYIYMCCVKRLHWAGHVVRMLVKRIPKWILEGSLRGWPARCLGIDGKPKCGIMSTNFSIPKTGMQQQRIAVIGGRKLGSPWPGNGLKRQRKKKEVEVEEKALPSLAIHTKMQFLCR
jgi:hypothetical protein